MRSVFCCVTGFEIMTLKTHQILLASVLALGVIGLQTQIAQSQQATELRPTLGNGALLVDENLDGIDDSQQELDRQSQQAPVFNDSLPIPDENRDDGNNTRQSNDGLNNTRSQAAADTASIRQLNNNADTSSVDGNVRATRATQVQITDPITGEASPITNRPLAPIEGTRRDPETDPYAAVGLRLGSFNLFPSIQQELGWTSNGESTDDGNSSAFSQTTLRTTFQSDWSVHELRGDISLDYQAFFDDETDNLPAANAAADLRIDVNREITARFGLAYLLATETPTSENLSLPAGFVLTGRPIINDLQTYAEIARNVGRLSTSLRATLTRTTFGDIETVSSGSVSQSDRNNYLLLATARAAYEYSPTLSPFFQVSAGGRIHDVEVDRNGNRRNSRVFEVQTGVAVDLGEKLNGSLGLGYRAEIFDDPTLNTLQSPLINATIKWSPERFTTISATLASSLARSIIADENGSVVHSATVTATRDIRPNFSVNARAFASFTDVDMGDREDLFLQAEVGAEWRLNRTVALTARAGVERAISSEVGSGFEAATVRAGIRIQR